MKVALIILFLGCVGFNIGGNLGNRAAQGKEAQNTARMERICASNPILCE